MSILFNGHALKYVKNQTEEIYKLAVLPDDFELEYVENHKLIIVIHYVEEIE